MSMHTNRSGFTLIEMIVSVGLFAVVMLVSTSAYLSLISLDRKARATNDLVTNLNFAIDTMEREMRAGSNYQCSEGITNPNCTQGGNGFVFVNNQGQTITYRLDPTHHSIAQCTGGSACTDSIDQALTDPRITVSNLKFYVRGVGTGDGIQPFANFTVTGTLTPDSVTGPITFTIQSSASQRLIEL